MSLYGNFEQIAGQIVKRGQRMNMTYEEMLELMNLFLEKTVISPFRNSGDAIRFIESSPLRIPKKARRLPRFSASEQRRRSEQSAAVRSMMTKHLIISETRLDEYKKNGASYSRDDQRLFLSPIPGVELTAKEQAKFKAVNDEVAFLFNGSTNWDSHASMKARILAVDPAQDKAFRKQYGITSDAPLTKDDILNAYARRRGVITMERYREYTNIVKRVEQSYNPSLPAEELAANFWKLKEASHFLAEFKKTIEGANDPKMPRLYTAEELREAGDTSRYENLAAVGICRFNLIANPLYSILDPDVMEDYDFSDSTGVIKNHEAIMDEEEVDENLNLPIPHYDSDPLVQEITNEFIAKHSDKYTLPELHKLFNNPEQKADGQWVAYPLGRGFLHSAFANYIYDFSFYHDNKIMPLADKANEYLQLFGLPVKYTQRYADQPDFVTIFGEQNTSSNMSLDSDTNEKSSDNLLAQGSPVAYQLNGRTIVLSQKEAGKVNVDNLTYEKPEALFNFALKHQQKVFTDQLSAADSMFIRSSSAFKAMKSSLAAISELEELQAGQDTAEAEARFRKLLEDTEKYLIYKKDSDMLNAAGQGEEAVDDDDRSSYEQERLKVARKIREFARTKLKELELTRQARVTLNEFTTERYGRRVPVDEQTRRHMIARSDMAAQLNARIRNAQAQAQAVAEEPVPEQPVAEAPAQPEQPAVEKPAQPEEPDVEDPPMPEQPDIEVPVQPTFVDPALAEQPVFVDPALAEQPAFVDPAALAEQPAFVDPAAMAEQPAFVDPAIAQHVPEETVVEAPVQPEEPVIEEPVMPEQPVKPAVEEPVMPEQPVKPAVEEPVMPEQPVKPAVEEPVMPEQPVKPAVEEPVMPEQPVKPAVEEPVMPEQPVKPAVEEPVMPEQPVKPAVEEPVMPEQPVKPAVEEPVMPEQPVKPAVEEPVMPEQPVKPAVEEPVMPEQPVKPAVEEPVQPKELDDDEDIKVFSDDLLNMDPDQLSAELSAEMFDKDPLFSEEHPEFDLKIDPDNEEDALDALDKQYSHADKNIEAYAQAHIADSLKEHMVLGKDFSSKECRSILSAVLLYDALCKEADDHTVDADGSLTDMLKNYPGIFAALQQNLEQSYTVNSLLKAVPEGSPISMTEMNVLLEQAHNLPVNSVDLSDNLLTYDQCAALLTDQILDNMVRQEHAASKTGEPGPLETIMSAGKRRVKKIMESGKDSTDMALDAIEKLGQDLEKETEDSITEFMENPGDHVELSPEEMDSLVKDTFTEGKPLTEVSQSELDNLVNEPDVENESEPELTEDRKAVVKDYMNSGKEPAQAIRDFIKGSDSLKKMISNAAVDGQISFPALSGLLKQVNKPDFVSEKPFFKTYNAKQFMSELMFDSVVALKNDKEHVFQALGEQMADLPFHYQHVIRTEIQDSSLMHTILENAGVKDNDSIPLHDITKLLGQIPTAESVLDTAILSEESCSRALADHALDQMLEREKSYLKGNSVADNASSSPLKHLMSIAPDAREKLINNMASSTGKNSLLPTIYQYEPNLEDDKITVTSMLSLIKGIDSKSHSFGAYDEKILDKDMCCTLLSDYMLDNMSELYRSTHNGKAGCLENLKEKDPEGYAKVRSRLAETDEVRDILNQPEEIDFDDLENAPDIEEATDKLSLTKLGTLFPKVRNANFCKNAVNKVLTAMEAEKQQQNESKKVLDNEKVKSNEVKVSKPSQLGK